MTDDAVQQYPSGQQLRYQLSRRSSRGAQIGCSLMLSLVLGSLSGFFLYMTWTHPGEGGNWIVYVVCGGFGLVALLLLYGAIHQTFALATPETLAEIDSRAIVPGEMLTIFIRQTGTGEYESIRVNLVGEEQTRRNQTWTPRHLGTLNMFDSGAFSLDGRSPFEVTFEFLAPPDLEPSMDDGSRRVTWQIELWGKVRGRADFQHVYPIEVVSGAS